MVVLGVFGVSIILFNIFYNPPTCDDRIQNGLEEGVDCGGSCPDLCPVAIKPLRDVWRRAFPVSEGVYAAVAYIENQNETLYVPEVQFEIELYDAERALIGRVSQKTTIMPNSNTPIFVPHILTGQREAASASFRFVKEPMFAEQLYPYGFELLDVQREIEEDEPPYVRATVKHVGEFAVRETDFVIILYDEEGTAIAASRTTEKDMRPEEERIIQFTWVHPLTLRKGLCPGGLCEKEVERVEVVPIIREW